MVPWQIPIIFANWKKPWGQLKPTTKRCLQIVKKKAKQRWEGEEAKIKGGMVGWLTPGVSNI